MSFRGVLAAVCLACSCNAQTCAPNADRRSSLPSCGFDQFWQHSYRIAEEWPVPSLNVVLEAVDGPVGSCSLYRTPAVCCDLARTGFDDEVHRVIASFLHGCQQRPCRVLDLGANVGMMTAYMLYLGAAVVSVEPQADLAEAIRATAKLNCWANRSVVLTAKACAGTGGMSAKCQKARKLRGSSFRAGGGWPDGLQEKLPAVGGLPLADVVAAFDRFGGRFARANSAAPMEVDFIKADGDGPEPLWLHGFAQLMATGRLSLGAILLEGNDLTSDIGLRALMSLQRSGFDAFRINIGYDERRLMTSGGWDSYSPLGTIGKLERVRGSLHRDLYEEELLSVRAMRRPFRFAPNLTRVQWQMLLAPLRSKSGNRHARFARHDLLLVNRSLLPLSRPVRALTATGKVQTLSPEAIAAKFTADSLRASGL